VNNVAGCRLLFRPVPMLFERVHGQTSAWRLLGWKGMRGRRRHEKREGRLRGRRCIHSFPVLGQGFAPALLLLFGLQVATFSPLPLEFTIGSVEMGGSTSSQTISCPSGLNQNSGLTKEPTCTADCFHADFCKNHLTIAGLKESFPCLRLRGGNMSGTNQKPALRASTRRSRRQIKDKALDHPNQKIQVPDSPAKRTSPKKQGKGAEKTSPGGRKSKSVEKELQKELKAAFGSDFAEVRTPRSPSVPWIPCHHRCRDTYDGALNGSRARLGTGRNVGRAECECACE